MCVSYIKQSFHNRHTFKIILHISKSDNLTKSTVVTQELLISLTIYRVSKFDDITTKKLF